MSETGWWGGGGRGWIPVPVGEWQPAQMTKTMLTVVVAQITAIITLRKCSLINDDLKQLRRDSDPFRLTCPESDPAKDFIYRRRIKVGVLSAA